jgi:hypothetical protein
MTANMGSHVANGIASLQALATERMKARTAEIATASQGWQL